MVHHVCVDIPEYPNYAFIRKLYWLENGWPVVAPSYIHEKEEEEILASNVIGMWKYILFPFENNGIQKSNTREIDENFFNSFEFCGQNRYKSNEVQVVFFNEWD